MTVSFVSALRKAIIGPRPAVAAAPGPQAPPLDLSAAHFHALAVQARDAGDAELAFRRFARANSLIPRYEPTRAALKEMSEQVLAQVDAAGDQTQRIYLLARAIEMNPFDEALRARLDALQAGRRGGADLTTMCFVFYDGARARQIHGEAYRRALEFVTIGGVVGEVLEFGVLGGWSARIFAETMRDLFNLNQLHLFDSFEGLPEYASEVDRNSFEIGGRNIWTDKMRFPQEFLVQFGQPHYWHIRDRLSEVIRAERIVIHKGYYADSLKANLGIKAALVHLDCDLYQSTAEVFAGLRRMDALQDGCVLLFDDWNCNRANPNYGQRRALREFLAQETRYTASPWFTYGYNGAAYILHDMQA